MEISRAMVAVGEMATYLSHEIRNPLSSIRLNLQMLKRDLAKDTVPDDAPQLVALCLTELQRLDDVVKTVLEVGRTHGSAQRDEKCDAHAVIADTLRVIQAKLAALGIDVQKKLGAETADVALGAAQLKSVLLNLLLNSIEALAAVDAKTITIATQILDTPGDVALELRITDTGHGIPAHLRERIFEPFFTTKTHGNGIGLATALRILQDCGGVLRCEPAVWDGGAEFVLEIPVVTASITTTPRRMAAAV
jgi:signal transduction histidine kinase